MSLVERHASVGLLSIKNGWLCLLAATPDPLMHMPTLPCLALYRLVCLILAAAAVQWCCCWTATTTQSHPCSHSGRTRYNWVTTIWVVVWIDTGRQLAVVVGREGSIN